MFNLIIATGNAAFEDMPREEVARILRSVADQLESGREGGFTRDINGNSVGTWNLEEGDE